jgi:Uma2 family endonuclease
MATANIATVAASVVIVPPPVIESSTSEAEPILRRFNVDEYYRMGEAGIFGTEERVELIRGAIVQMNPIGNPHAECCDRLNEMLVLAFTKRAKIRVSNPIRLDEMSEPQPDFAILKLRDKPRETHPKADEVLVAIEVSVSSIRYDRNVKAPLYAEFGIPEYWLVDLESETIEVRRKPIKSGYEELQTLRRGDQLRCLAFSDTALDVAAILG